MSENDTKMGLIKPELFHKSTVALAEYADELGRMAVNVERYSPGHILVNDLKAQRNTVIKILNAFMNSAVLDKDAVNQLVDDIQVTDDHSAREFFCYEDKEASPRQPIEEEFKN